MSKEELVKTLQSLENENSILRSVINNCNNPQSADYKYDSEIPFEIKRNLDCGNLVIPYFHFPHAYMLTNMQGEVLFACPNMLKLFGYDNDYKYLHKSVFDYLAPERLERAKQFFKDQKIYKEESIGVKANGEQFYIEINGNIIKDSEGKPTNIVFLVRDVDQRKKNEERLHVLSNAIEQSPVAVVITDVLGNIEYVNPKAIETTGYDLQELIGQNPRVLKSGETSYNEYKIMWETIKDGKIWNGLFHNKKKNGELYWESSTIAPVLNDRGDIVRFVAIKEDVTRRKNYEKEILDLNVNLEKKIEERTSELTEINVNFLKEIVDRKKAEKALKEKSEEFETFFEVTLDLLSIHEIDGKFLRTNKSWTNTFGYNQSYFESRNILEFFHPNDIDDAKQVIEQLKTLGKIVNVINRCKMKDGTYRFFEWNTVSDGNKIYSAGRDITERKRNEDFEMELLQLSTQLTGMPQNKMDEAINLALSKIGKFLGADRTSIFNFDRETKQMSNAFEWCNVGIPSHKDSLQNIPLDSLPSWREKIANKENIVIPSVEKLPKSWSKEKAILQSHGFKSIIAMPMYSDEQLYGFVGIDTIENEKIYTESEINILNIWKNILTNLLLKIEADKLLEITQRNFEIFFNTIDDFLSVIDKNGKIINVNNTILNRLGYTKEELKGHLVSKIYPQNSTYEIIQNIFEKRQEDSEFCLESLKSKNNINISVETRLKLGSWNGETVVFCVSKDISKLQLSEQKFATVFELGSAIMSISDYDTGEFIDVNNSFVEISGYKKDEIIGFTLNKNRFFDRNEIINKINKNISVRDMEIKVSIKNNELRTALLSADAVYIGDRKCLLTISVDITDRKKSEEQLYWNKSLLELMSSSTPLGFLVIDNNTDNILYFNKKFCEIWNVEQFMPQMSSGVFKNRDLRSHYAKCLNNPETFFESIKPLYDMSNRVVISDEIPFVGNRTIRRFSTQIRGANDMYYGRFYMFEDITQSKLAEEKLRIASFEAEKANEAKSEFLSRMSHELRTPLNSILGFAQLLEMTELNDVQKKGTNHILNSGKHLLNLINDVLDISRIEAGRLVLYAETISIKEIVMETIEILQTMAENASVNIKFTCNIEDDLVKTDRQSLKQILVNILNNAIKYNKPQGSVFINVENNKESEKTIISITDTGIGISNSNLQRIFDPFERIGADLTSIEGTGLGLSVVKKLINAVGSEIYVESKLGKGSKFWFELPKGKNYYHFENLVQNKNEILPTKKGKKTVLYIEDNASSIELLEEIISNSCQEITLYNETKGQNAISVINKIKPDVVLLDLNLPDVHGTEILKNIRKDNSFKQLPIIIVSADALPRHIDEVMNLGATYYITKPFDVKQVIEIFNSL